MSTVQNAVLVQGGSPGSASHEAPEPPLKQVGMNNIATQHTTEIVNDIEQLQLDLNDDSGVTGGFPGSACSEAPEPTSKQVRHTTSDNTDGYNTVNETADFLPTESVIPTTTPLLCMDSHTQTARSTNSMAVQTVNTTFSALTCKELVQTLSDEQLNREILYFENSNDMFLVKSRVTRRPATSAQQREALGQMLQGCFDNEYVTHLSYPSNVSQFLSTSITSDFSCTLEHLKQQTELITEKLSNAQQQLDEFMNFRVKPANTTPELKLPESCHDCNGQGIIKSYSGEDVTNDLNTLRNCKCPFIKYSSVPFNNLSYEALNSSTDYTHNFSNRRVAYYGDAPYKYPGAKHTPRPISDNTVLKSLVDNVNELFPTLTFNSGTVQHYENGQCTIPPHSDNEPEIMPGSMILTVSLGETRTCSYRRKVGQYEKVNVELAHGDVILMTRLSQDHFDHSIPEDASRVGPRASVTLRFIVDPKSIEPKFEPTVSKPSQQSTASIKRVLVLTDSRNKTFDPSIFREPVVCFKQMLYNLNQLPAHREEISKADIVVLSCGVNDICRLRAGGWSLFSYLENLIKEAQTRFPNTTFLFGSVSPVGRNIDRNNIFNKEINEFNKLCFNMSLRYTNFYLFDNIRYKPQHLARDGIHLTEWGKKSLSSAWVHSVLTFLGFRRGPLPIREEYQELFRQHNSSSQRVGPPQRPQRF